MLDTVKTLAYLCVWFIWYIMPGYALVRLLHLNFPDWVDPSGWVVLWIVTGIATHMHYPLCKLFTLYK